MRESDDLEQWIGEQMQTALSDDYGQDYEHLQVWAVLKSHVQRPCTRSDAVMCPDLFVDSVFIRGIFRGGA